MLGKTGLQKSPLQIWLFSEQIAGTEIFGTTYDTHE